MDELKREHVLIAGEALAPCALLYPPWVHGGLGLGMGYAVVLDPPHQARIDLGGLIVTLAVPAVLTAVGLALVRQRSSSPSTASFQSLLKRL